MSAGGVSVSVMESSLESVPALPHPCWVALSKSVHFSEPQFPQL